MSEHLLSLTQESELIPHNVQWLSTHCILRVLNTGLAQPASVQLNQQRHQGSTQTWRHTQLLISVESTAPTSVAGYVCLKEQTDLDKTSAQFLLG